MSIGSRPKVVVVGAGSASFGRTSIADLLGHPTMEGLPLDLWLVDTNARSLEIMTGLANRLKEHFHSATTIRSTTDRTEALPGADFVVIAVTVRRREFWEQDYRVASARGFKAIYGENGGPGAAFHALRNFRLVVPICEDVERICPEAQVLNFTNPESRIVTAISRLTKAKAVGLCHGVMMAMDRASEILGVPADALDIVSTGINHFFWFKSIADRRTGEDLYPILMKRIKDDPSLIPPVAREMIRIFGLYTFPWDNHIGEYLSWAHEVYGVRWSLGREWHPIHPGDPESLPSRGAAIEALIPYAEGERPLDGTATRISGELLAPIVSAMALNRKTWLPGVNVVNREGAIANVDREAIVEVTATADAEGVHPLMTGDLPEGLAALVRTQVSIQKLIVEAYREKSRRLLLQALLLDPTVDSLRNAEALIEDMFELQGDFLPDLR